MHESLAQIDLQSINFSNSVVLLNRSKRIVLPIPELPDGGEPLIFPDGHPKAGENIYSNPDGSPQRGIVFPNKTDGGWQGVQGNGKEAIVINDLSAGQAARALEFVASSVPNITSMTAQQALTIVHHLREELGLIDMFDKDLGSILLEMRPVDLDTPTPRASEPGSFLVYMEVSKDTEHQAVRIDRAFTPTGGSIDQRYPEGAVVVNDGSYTWGLDKGVCERNWLLKGALGEEPIRTIEADIPLVGL